MFDEINYQVIISIILIGILIGLYVMKDTIFPVKHVQFNPVVNTIDSDSDFIPSETFTGKKPGYVFKTDEQGLGYYKDAIEMEKLK